MASISRIGIKTPGGILFLAGAALLPLGSARAQDETERAIQRLEEALSREPGLSKETRDALMEMVRALRAKSGMPPAAALEAEIQEVLRKSAPLEPAKKAPSPFTLYGDFRLRHETSWHLDDQDTRNRERIRLRLGADVALAESLKAGARITTGSRTDARSPHQTLGDAFNRFEMNFDRAYATWRPDFVPGTWLTGGKFAHPFVVNPVYGELVWDADVQPEGVAAGWSRDAVGPLGKVQIVGGEYILIEQSGGDEASAFVAQGTAQPDLGNDWKGTLGAGIYRYSDLAPDDSQAVVSHNAGNATVGAAPTLDFASRFTILNAIAAVTQSGLPLPLTLAGEWIHNTRAEVNGDSGYAVGGSYGASKSAGDWRLYYQWQVVEQDAVLSPFSQDDFLFGTNHRSHLAGVNYQFLDNVGFHVWGLFSQRDRTDPASTTTDSDQFQYRARADLNLRF